MPVNKQRNRKKPIRHTHSTAAALEDITAILFDVIRELSASIQYALARLPKAMDIARKSREGPHAYDPDGKNTKTEDRKILRRK